MNIQIKINQKELQKGIQDELKKVVRRSIPRIETKLNISLKELLQRRFIEGLPVVTPSDIGEMGIPDLENRLFNISQAASNSFKVTVRPANLLRIDIGILKSDYSDLLSLNESIFQYFSKEGNNILPWLEWILKGGNGTIVSGYDFREGSYGSSRTGLGLMFKGNGWAVPPNLRGTEQDNILTRCLSAIDRDIEKVVKDLLSKELR